jgi:TctA family transporter
LFQLKKAYGFYGVITIATLVGLMINFVGIDPIMGTGRSTDGWKENNG